MINLKKISMFALILIFVGIVGNVITFSSLDKATAVTEEKSFGNNFSAIQVNTKDVGVEVVPTKEKTAKVRLHGHKSNETYNFSADVKGTTLSVEAEKSHHSWINIYPTALRVTIYLPDKQYETMHIDSTNGSIQAENMKVNDIKTKTANGWIMLKSIVATDLDVKTTNGWIKLNSIAATDVNVKTAHGQINLEDVQGKISGESQAGQIILKTESLNRPVEFKTDSGRILVQTEQKPDNVTFDVHTGAGSINILDQYTGSTTIGKGENLIKLSTGAGSITVE
ncbi:DUF4097 family beta strand repeat-containing protein [Thermoactinomyces mirandus]|uniref:DUF4097 family beta strand repeat protein n=1 Tax=Thermoactinomyces mirandus TaxID=2756294 RepID=A0A7W2ASH2_9BACL|nr:DUF4097 family beta strand repeat-containing protein [Thermoactinomyces mirandus]MBA4603427.1 DUF4097 family beta strand repeat protein [Thermoactinomyces mirandus]